MIFSTVNGRQQRMQLWQTVLQFEFVEMLVENLDALTTHNFVAKAQGSFFKSSKENLDETNCIIVLDFSENYSFVVQNAVQSFHWNNQQCTIHPAVLYYKSSGRFVSKSFSFLSADLSHDTPFVFECQKRLSSYIKRELTTVKKVMYYSDGCGGQYKNYKNFMNLCCHRNDFGLDAGWHFFATSHGKSVVDGIGGTIKRLVAKASLQMIGGLSILSAADMFKYCTNAIPGITFELIDDECLIKTMNEQHDRHKLGRTVPGTRIFHCVIPCSMSEISYKTISQNESICGSFSFAKRTSQSLDLKKTGLCCMRIQR